MKNYLEKTTQEKIEENIAGLEEELTAKNISTLCEDHKVYCIGCALSELRKNIKNLTESK
jgi:hypothetical protein